MSKCTGDSVSSDWVHEIVNFNPYPHEYSTLNLPSWSSCDSPIVNQNRIGSNCCYHENYSEFDNGLIPLVNDMYVRANGHWARQHYLGETIYETKKNSHGWLYYGGNALHWDNNGRGALNLYSDQTAGFDTAFQLGDVDSSWYPSTLTTIDTNNRWMPAVYGIQFEWDSGIHFPDIDDHKHDDTNTNSHGYRLKTLIMHYSMIDQNGKILDDMALVLVKNGIIPPGICYWHEGYSLIDLVDWQDQALGQGYSSKDGGPMRKGKCGFAIDSNTMQFDLIKHCAITSDKDGKRYHYMQGSRDASDLTNPRVTRLGAQMVWRSTYFAFSGNRSDGTAKKKNFRMWNCKPITVPVTYQDPNKTHCHATWPTYDDEYDSDVNDRYKPWEHKDVAVINNTAKGGPQSSNMREVVPGLGDIKENSYHYLYTSKELRNRRDNNELHADLEATIRGRSSLPLTGEPANFDPNGGFQSQGIPAPGETGWYDK